MRNIINAILVILAITAVVACNNSPVEGKIVYVPVTDTITVSDVTRIVALEHELKLTRDSLNLIKDSIGENLFIARYKLARIKYYNDIAAKGNNIKYLRGWINRVINE